MAQTQSSSLGTELLGDPLPLEGRDLASSSAPVQLLFSPQSGLSALVLPKMRLTEALLSVDIGLEERLGLGLGLGCKIARTLAEVEERVNLRVNRLKTQLNKKETELRKRHQLEERLRNEKLELDVRVAYLSRQVSAATEMIEKLNNDLEVKEKELSKRQQEMVDIEWFLRDLAEREAKAKVKLQVFIESLLDRADRAERHLLMLTSHKHYSPVHRCGHSPVFTGGSLDDIITSRCQESLGNRQQQQCALPSERKYSSLEELQRLRLLSARGPPVSALQLQSERSNAYPVSGLSGMGQSPQVRPTSILLRLGPSAGRYNQVYRR